MPARPGSVCQIPTCNSHSALPARAAGPGHPQPRARQPGAPAQRALPVPRRTAGGTASAAPGKALCPGSSSAALHGSSACPCAGAGTNTGAGAGFTASSLAPQHWQNRAFSTIGLPQMGQHPPSLAPQCWQKAAPSTVSFPHAGQFMEYLSVPFFTPCHR